MSTTTEKKRPEPGVKKKGAEKLARLKVKIEPTVKPLQKPEWIRVRLTADQQVANLKKLLRQQKLHTVCEEASCPNLSECFSKGTATFMIMGDICTRRCPFCDVGHGRPNPLDSSEPEQLAQTIEKMGLRYVVITSVDRDDLRDGGATHFVHCITAVRQQTPNTQIEILVPDFRGRMERALAIFGGQLPDVFNHNLETVPRLYSRCRPGANYQWSLDLLNNFRQQHRDIPTKSGLMLGLGEEIEEVHAVMRDLRDHHCSMLTLGQYLQPTRHHLPVERFVTPQEFEQLKKIGLDMGFSHVASGPMVRSSYHADVQAKNVLASTRES